MIAMQYRFALPTDYDMGIVRRRIVEKGPLLDDFPNLKFKAYLWAERGADSMYTSAHGSIRTPAWRGL